MSYIHYLLITQYIPSDRIYFCIQIGWLSSNIHIWNACHRPQKLHFDLSLLNQISYFEPWPFFICFVLLHPQHNLWNSWHHVQLLDDRVHVTCGTTILQPNKSTSGPSINRRQVLNITIATKCEFPQEQFTHIHLLTRFINMYSAAQSHSELNRILFK